MTGFDTGWELDFWGEFRRNIAAENAEVLASIASYDDVLVSLVAEVAATYIQLRTLEERLRLARNNVQIQSRSEQIADVRFRNGAVTELDVTQATALLRNTDPDAERCAWRDRPDSCPAARSGSRPANRPPPSSA